MKKPKIYLRYGHENIFLSLVLTLVFQFSLFAQKAEDYFNKGVAEDSVGYSKDAFQDSTKAIDDYKVAIEDLTKAIEINPNYAPAYFYRGVAKYYLKDNNGACLDWRKAGELGYAGANSWITDFCK